MSSDDIDQGEVDKIRDTLDSDETVLMTAKESRVKGSKTNPSTVFATDRRLIIRHPGLISHGDIQDFAYDQISSINLKKGMFSSQLIVSVPGLDSGGVPAMSKDKAEKLHKIIREKIAEAKKQGGSTIVQQKESPMDALKMKLVNGEISQEEFEKTKSLLE